MLIHKDTKRILRRHEKQTDNCPIVVVVMHLLNNNFLSLWHGSDLILPSFFDGASQIFFAHFERSE